MRIDPKGVVHRVDTTKSSSFVDVTSFDDNFTSFKSYTIPTNTLKVGDTFKITASGKASGTY